MFYFGDNSLHQSSNSVKYINLQIGCKLSYNRIYTMFMTNNPTNDAIYFQVYQCTRESCLLRFSLEAGSVVRCPVCRAPVAPVGMPYGRQAVRAESNAAPGPQLEVLLDNIRSAWNVGSMLRSADGAGVSCVHLCGVSAAPDNPKVAKTALGAERSLPWQHAPDGVQLAQALKAAGMRLWALEGGERAESLFDLRDEIPGSPMLLIAGNELTGVDPGLLDLCEHVASLPMGGMKGSLNVAVAFGIAVYFIRYGVSRPFGQDSF
jgi:tRNA(Leu) C34 or U34 (ribose-2'-O)-methylase TrmL